MQSKALMKMQKIPQKNFFFSASFAQLCRHWFRSFKIKKSRKCLSAQNGNTLLNESNQVNELLKEPFSHLSTKILCQIKKKLPFSAAAGKIIKHDSFDIIEWWLSKNGEFFNNSLRILFSGITNNFSVKMSLQKRYKKL